jgi:hypothetical protein
MSVEEFEIVDLGVAVEGSFEAWGPSYSTYTNAVVGSGPTGEAALQDALNQIAILGINAASVEAEARESGYFSQDAATPLEEIIDGDDLLQDKAVSYFIGIRFDDPNLAENEEDEGEEDDDEGGEEVSA